MMRNGGSLPSMWPSELAFMAFSRSERMLPPGDLPKAGPCTRSASVTAGEAFADVESVKAVSDVYSPVTGTVCEINEALLDAPESINQDPYGAWFIRVENVTGTVETLSAAEYEAMPKEG